MLVPTSVEVIAVRLRQALAAVLLLIAPGLSTAVVVLNSVSQSSFGFIVDGTSNTLLFGEATRGSACFRNVTMPRGIADGTSNTLLLNERVAFRVVPTL